MADLRTTYLGIPVANPIVLAASSASSKIENVQLAQRFGVGAVVLRSLFEEQILADRGHFEESLAMGSDAHDEALDYFPQLGHADAEEYLLRIGEVKKHLHAPVIASLNAVRPGSWTAYAKQMADAGADAIELNVYAVAADPLVSGSEVEAMLFDLVEGVIAEVNIPVSVKLSPFYTSVVNVVAELSRRGAAGVILFNRFLQPDIDPITEQLTSSMALSSASELRLPLRYVAMLHQRCQADLIISTGVHRGDDVVRGLLAGAQATQVAASVIKNGMHHIGTLIRDLESWMDEHSYHSIDEFRGNVSQKSVADPFAFERAQYVNLMLNSQGAAPLTARVN